MKYLYDFLFLALLLFDMAVCELEFKYHSNKELQDILTNFNETVKDPLSVNVYSIGQTHDKNELLVAEITTAKRNSLKVPNVKLIANIHGDEAVGREVLLQFLFYLRDEYHNGNATIEWLLNNTKIHILPTLNPDGFNRSRVPDDECVVSRVGRENGKGKKDLNRNFPDYFHKNKIMIQPETHSVMKWMEHTPFILSASLHGGAVVANYPFDTAKEKSSNFRLGPMPSLTPDEDVFRHLATSYAKNHLTMHLGKHCHISRSEFPNGITNGAQWYHVVGSMQDYNYFQHGCMELTLEISCCKYPIAAELPKYWEENREALVKFVQEAHKGIAGQILDEETRLPIEGAKLQILGRNMTFTSFKNTGEFWRILLPGNYTLKVQAQGYYDKLVPFEISTKSHKVDIDVFLKNSSISTTSTTSASITTSTATTSPENNISSTVPISEPPDDYKLLLENKGREYYGYSRTGELLNNSGRCCLFSLGLVISVITLIIF